MGYIKSKIKNLTGILRVNRNTGLCDNQTFYTTVNIPIAGLDMPVVENIFPIFLPACLPY